ncbi:flagellar hook-length control protein FliK [Ferrimonas balearica]|uniref:flagellar hook-length control protein FliK n=1 Tax=Ferrimonas balearica TaxID=44012 RepID=UPI001C99A998|nr:flagellar hook-length control protein FliK [Ferrimonas balearica]MBY5921297.1 flagellar hook-length control protein FliK [Ferrimonas balearica]MBY5996018.1 flagellar hook-length control protein FliK [Ferrimonas balearica]
MSNLIAPPISAVPATGGALNQRAEEGEQAESSLFASLVADAEQTQSGSDDSADKIPSEKERASLVEQVKALPGEQAISGEDTGADSGSELSEAGEKRQAVATPTGLGGSEVLLEETPDALMPSSRVEGDVLESTVDSDELLSQLAALDKAKRQMDGAEPAIEPTVEPVGKLAAESLTASAPLDTMTKDDAALKPDGLESGQAATEAKPGSADGVPSVVAAAGKTLDAVAQPTGHRAEPMAASLGQSNLNSGIPVGNLGSELSADSGVESKLVGAEGVSLSSATSPSSAGGGLTASGQSAAIAMAAQGAMNTPEGTAASADTGSDLSLDLGDGPDGDHHRILNTESAQRQSTRAPVGAESALMRQPVAAERLAPELRERLAVMINSERLTAELRLDPPELGALQVRIQMNGDQAQVQIQTQNAQARDLLEQALPRLREMLQGQGIQLADANVSQQQSGGQSESRGGSAGTGGESASQEELVAHQISNRNAEGGIDFYA